MCYISCFAQETQVITLNNEVNLRSVSNEGEKTGSSNGLVVLHVHVHVHVRTHTHARTHACMHVRTHTHTHTHTHTLSYMY